MFFRSSQSKVEEIREFDLDALDRDENGDVILPKDISYAEFLHLMHPELTEEELRQAIAKETKSVWSVRLLLAAFAVVVILIIAFILTGSF